MSEPGGKWAGVWLARSTIRCYLVHRRRVGRFQRRPPPQRLLRLIRTTVGNNNHIFHGQTVLLLGELP